MSEGANDDDGGGRDGGRQETAIEMYWFLSSWL